MAASHDCIMRTTAPFAAARPVVVSSGRVRLARRDVDLVFGTDAGCRPRRRLDAVCAACRSSNLALPDGSRERAISRSRCCFQRAGGCLELACSAGRSRVLGIDAVGGAPYCDFANEGGARGGFPVQPRPARRHLGRRRLQPGRRGRRPVGIVLPGSRPRWHGHGAFLICRGARAVDQGWYAPTL